MTVRKMIEALSYYNPNFDVKIQNVFRYCDYDEIQDVKFSIDIEDNIVTDANKVCFSCEKDGKAFILIKATNK